ncbi:MAG: hypothetical protein EU536_00300 [Promethearchaeota archaeon]|nr:MAG: hypothetical protein EU536_00300 [Candidatus Lokiarchaeota archaeon]
MTVITEVTVEVFIQATEESEKIKTAVKNLFPPEMRDGIKFAVERLRGVFHNPIKVVKVKATANTEEIIKYLTQQLTEADKEYLKESLSRRIAKGKLFLRLGKQELYQGHMELKEIKDMVKVCIKFAPHYSKDKVLVEILQELGLIN